MLQYDIIVPVLHVLFPLNVATDGGPVDIPVARVAVHPSYSNVSLKNDVAVVTLARPAPINQRISPVCLPDSLTGGADLSRQFQRMTVVGWGATMDGGRTVSALRQAEVPVVSCKRMRQRLRLGIAHFHRTTRSNMRGTWRRRRLQRRLRRWLIGRDG
jgi:secreted trypsin-like serine protease